MFLDDLPFDRGQTFFNGQTANATDGANLEGHEYRVWSSDYNQYITLRLMRNISGIALAAKRLVNHVAGKEYRQVDGYTTVFDQWCSGVVDEKYTGTIPNNDIFYAVVDGPALVNSNLAADATNVWSVGDFLTSCTAATSQATTAGRLAAGTLAITGNTGAQELKDLFNHLGRALTARTTANTAVDTLVHFRKF